MTEISEKKLSNLISKVISVVLNYFTEILSSLVETIAIL